MCDGVWIAWIEEEVLMAIVCDYNAEQQRIALRGELTIYHVSAAKELLLAHPGARLDMSDVSELDGAGLQLLLLAKREAGATLVAASDAVMDVLRLTGLQELMEGAA